MTEPFVTRAPPTMHRVPAILVLSFFSVLSSFAAEQRPNILFILTEDQGAHMGALGTTDVKTPHMDALAASGALFRRAYVGYPVCSASKACSVDSSSVAEMCSRWRVTVRFGHAWGTMLHIVRGKLWEPGDWELS